MLIKLICSKRREVIYINPDIVELVEVYSANESKHYRIYGERDSEPIAEISQAELDKLLEATNDRAAD